MGRGILRAQGLDGNPRPNEETATPTRRPKTARPLRRSVNESMGGEGATYIGQVAYILLTRVAGVLTTLKQKWGGAQR